MRTNELTLVEDNNAQPLSCTVRTTVKSFYSVTSSQSSFPWKGLELVERSFERFYMDGVVTFTPAFPIVQFSSSSDSESIVFQPPFLVFRARCVFDCTSCGGFHPNRVWSVQFLKSCRSLHSNIRTERIWDQSWRGTCCADILHHGVRWQLLCEELGFCCGFPFLILNLIWSSVFADQSHSDHGIQGLFAHCESGVCCVLSDGVGDHLHFGGISVQRTTRSYRTKTTDPAGGLWLLVIGY